MTEDQKIKQGSQLFLMFLDNLEKDIHQKITESFKEYINLASIKEEDDAC